MEPAFGSGRCPGATDTACPVGDRDKGEGHPVVLHSGFMAPFPARMSYFHDGDKTKLSNPLQVQAVGLRSAALKLQTRRRQGMNLIPVATMAKNINGAGS